MGGGEGGRWRKCAATEVGANNGDREGEMKKWDGAFGCLMGVLNVNSHTKLYFPTSPPHRIVSFSHPKLCHSHFSKSKG